MICLAAIFVTGAAFAGNGSSPAMYMLLLNPSFGTVESAGQIWMDRNLGASRIATSPTDSLAYGDLYQWGRGTDGHEKRDSPTTSTLSSSDSPGHGSFILSSSTPFDWRSPQNHNLWQGVSGTNNPCPAGFRLPTSTEWMIESYSWTSIDAAGVYGSPLKLVMAGSRARLNGKILYKDTAGAYWSSTVYGINDSNSAYISNSVFLGFHDSGAKMYVDGSRAYGFSVRCLKD